MSDREKNVTKIKGFALLHSILLVYSLGCIFSKLASKEEFLSSKFIVFYAIVLLIMAFYAIMWQQVLKQMNLVTAYANKAVTVIWGLIWGAVIFKESISVFNIMGTMIIILGVYFVVTGEEDI